MSGAAPPANLLMPKSRTLGTMAPVPGLCRKMFAGLRSRCTMPLSWASASARAMSAMLSSAMRVGTGPAVRRIRTSSEAPSSSSITRNGVSSSSAAAPTSKISMMLG